MHILVDYRPALRQRTGVGEYVHQLIRAYAAAHVDTVLVFTSSWKDRPAPTLAKELGATVTDWRIPVRVLNLLWHRLGWPAVEMLAGPVDVVHAAHPLLIPARRAAQVVTIHDLFFMTSPSQTSAEVRRDYSSLAAAHARRAHAVITSTAYGKRIVSDRLGVPADRIYVCPPGAPSWQTLGRSPNVPRDGCLLFLGTLEPRKNIGALLDAYSMLVRRLPTAPPLVLAGRRTAAAHEWMARINQPPLAGRVRYVGYVADSDRERLYAGARVLVVPSLDEGFGLPALEAMSAGIPVVASNRGSLPEVLGDAGTFVDPADITGLADALERFVSDEAAATRAGAAGLVRAQAFTWDASVKTLHRAYLDAVARRSAE
jgi:glycosyltransferase involved in cell wall biosynthesis